MTGHRSSLRARFGAVLLAGAFLARPARGADNPKPDSAVREAVGVSLVEVPANVLDGDGKPVRGLTKEDFEVFDDGKKVALESLDVSEFPASKGTLVARREEFQLVRRKFVLLFDLSFSTPAELTRARDGARRFVREQMGEADIAAVGTVSVKGEVQLLQNLTRDRERLAAAIETVKPPDTLSRHETDVSPVDGGKAQFSREEVEWLNQPGHAREASWMTRLLEALTAVARSLKAVDGRKHVVLFSHGFDIMTDDTRLLRALEPVIAEYRLDDCVLHTIDLAGLSARHSDQEVLFALATETGGHLMENSNDFSGQLDRVLEATSVVYVLTFKPSLTGRPGRFHELKVRSLRKGTKVFARAGYVEPSAP